MKTKDSLTKKIELLFEQSNVDTQHPAESFILDKLQLRYEPIVTAAVAGSCVTETARG